MRRFFATPLAVIVIIAAVSLVHAFDLASALAGKWEEEKATETMELFSDGRAAVYDAKMRVEGKYRVIDEKSAEFLWGGEFEKLGPIVAEFTFAADGTLEMRLPNGTMTKYKRVK